MVRTSFAVAIAMVLAVVVAVLVTTRDLNQTNDIFENGVIQAQKVDAVTDLALTAGDELPTALDTFPTSIEQTLSVITQLQRAQGELDGLATQLSRAADVLISADAPLAFIIGEVVTSYTAVETTNPTFDSINELLQQANGQVNVIAGQLDNTIRLAREIESKLHILGGLNEILNIGN